MAKQIIQIGIEKVNLDGTEMLELQEAAGGVGSSKRFSVTSAYNYFLGLLQNVFATLAQGNKADTAVQSVQPGANVTVDNADPINPVVGTNANVVSSNPNVFTAQQTVTPYRANIIGAVSIDLAGTAKSNTLILTLTGNVTSFALTSPADGAKYSIWFIQDATGGRTMPVLPTNIKLGNTPPTWTTTAGAIDLLCLDYGATENIYVAAFSPNR